MTSSVRFGPVTIAYDDGVLEPRSWTLEQARWAAERIGALGAGSVLELCCGAGQIGLALIASDGDRPLVQVDVDETACATAKRNASANGIVADVRCGEMEDAVRSTERFVLVLADPPYVPTAETGRYPDDPDLAIDGGDDGLAVADRCLAVAGAHVEPGGEVLVQARGAEQAATLAQRAPGAGLEPLEIRTYGPDRAVLLLRSTVG